MTDKKALLQKYTAKLVKDAVINEIYFNKQDVSDLFLDVKIVRYMSLSNRTPDDLSVIACSYNLYYYKEGVQFPIYPVDEEVLKDGQFYAAVVLSNEDTEVLYMSTDVQDDDSDKEEKVKISEKVTDEVVQYVDEMLSTIRGVKVPNSRLKLNGIGQHPKVPFEKLQPLWKKALNNSLGNLYAYVHEVMMDNLSMDTKDTYMIPINKVEVSMSPIGEWSVTLLVHPKNKDGHTLPLDRQPKLTIPFIYNNDVYKKEFEEYTIALIEEYTANLKPETFGNLTLMFTPYYNVPSEMEKLVASKSQTEYVFQRLAKVLEGQKESDIISNVKQKGPYLVMDIYSKATNEQVTSYFGGEGFKVGEILYYRKGTEQEGNKDFAFKSLSHAFGPSRVWIDLLSCYDFRKKV